MTGAIGALLKELVTSGQRYRRTKVAPWYEPGEDGVIISGKRGYIGLILAEFAIGTGSAVVVGLFPLFLAAGAAGLGGATVLAQFISQER